MIFKFQILEIRVHKIRPKEGTNTYLSLNKRTKSKNVLQF